MPQSHTYTPPATERTDSMMEAFRGLVELVCPSKPGQSLEYVPSGALYELLNLVYEQLKHALDLERDERTPSTQGETR